MKRRLAVKVGVRLADLTFNHVLYRPAEWLARRYSSVGQHHFFDVSAFAWIPRIESRWTAIRDEVRALLRDRQRIPSLEEIAPGNTPGEVRDGQWKSYWLYAYGRKTADNCRRCPETTRLIEMIPGIKTAFFSILAPGKHITEHTGPYAGVLRYHLGLIVPRQKTACRIRVGSDVAHWEEGRSLVFDDTYPHEVWNETDEERVVLFIDFARPLPFPVSALNEAVIRLASRSAFVQDIVENIDEWNQQNGAGNRQPSVRERSPTS
jgi:aspartyl/asparaginyl beta-hydroxylase (cupin superfamily)